VLDEQVDRLTTGALGGLTGNTTGNTTGGTVGLGSQLGGLDLTHGVLQPRGRRRAAPAAPEPDALDALLDTATRRKQGDGGAR
jgi:hypothetical protein